MTPSDLALTAAAVADADDDRDRARIVARALGCEDDWGVRELLLRAFEAARDTATDWAWEEGYSEGQLDAKAEAA